jgi:hypothetical protein
MGGDRLDAGSAIAVLGEELRRRIEDAAKQKLGLFQ